MKFSPLLSWFASQRRPFSTAERARATFVPHLEILENRLAPATLTFTGNAAAYSAGTGIANGLTVSLTGDTYTFMDTAGDPIAVVGAPAGTVVTNNGTTTVSVNLGVGARITGLTLDLGDSTDTLTIGTSTAGLTIAGNISNANTETVNVNNALTTTNNGSATLTATTGTLTVAAAGDVNADGSVNLVAGTSISTAGDVTTSNDAITFGAPVTLTGNVAVNPGNAMVLFNNTVTATTSGLTVTNNGTTQFDNTVTLQALTVTGGTTNLNAGNVTTTGNQTYSNLVNLGGDKTLTCDINATITINGTYTGGNAALTISGSATLGAAVTGVTTLTVTGLIANIFANVTTTLAQTYNADLTLEAAATTLAGTTITFNGNADGPFTSLTIAGNAVLGDAAADSFVFQTLTVSGTTIINASGLVTSGTRQMDGTQTFTGAVTVNSVLLNQPTGDVAFNGNVTINQTIAFGTERTITVSGDFMGTGGLTKLGGGTITLTGTNTYTGATTISAGTLVVNGSTAAASAVTLNGTLGGTGTVNGSVQAGSNGTINAGAPTVTGNLTIVGNLTSTAANPVNVTVDITATASDLITANAGVDLTGSVLTLNSTPGLEVGRQITVINKTSAGPVTGTFVNLPQGTTFTDPAGNLLQITYIGDSGNDVVLTVLSAQPAPVLTPPLNNSPNGRFVNGIYNVQLNRQVDSTGDREYVGQLASGVSRMLVAQQIVNSDESFARLINEAYNQFLDRNVDPVGLAASTNFLRTNGTLARLRVILVTSLEFAQRFNVTSDLTFLQALYLRGLGRMIDPSSQDFYLNRLATGTSRVQVAQGVLTSREFFTRIVDGGFVFTSGTILSYYSRYLDRVGDAGGIDSYVNQLLAGQSELSMQVGFLISTEFTNRVGG
jgi:hypothetical protein